MVLAAVLVAGYVVLRLLDAVIYRLIGPSMEGRAALEGEDWYWLLRVAGSLWAWIVVAAGLVSLDAMGRVRRAGRSAWRRGAFVLGSAVGAGVGAELAKLVLARERPSVINGGVLEYQGHVYLSLIHI